jgi:hypothetical protein
MSTRGQLGPESTHRKTRTRSKQTEQLITEHREPETFDTDTETEPEETEPEETEPEQLEIELNQTDEELARELERLQMAESKGTESKGKNTQEQAIAIVETANPNARLIGDPGVFSGKRTEFADWWRIMQIHLKLNNVNPTARSL